MTIEPRPPFDPKSFLAKVNRGRTIHTYGIGEAVFRQGDPADVVFYVQSGTAKVAILSEQGKEAVVAIHKPGDFFG